MAWGWFGDSSPRACDSNAPPTLPSRVKIGFFLPNATFDLPGSPEVGGIETFTFDVGEAMQRLGHEVVLFSGRPKAGRRHRPTTLRLALFDYVETDKIPDLGKRFRRLMQRLHFGWSCLDAWTAERFDVAFVAKPFDWPVAWLWKRRQPGLRVVMGFHGTDFFPGDRWFYRAIDREFAVSCAVAELAAARIGRRPVVVYNPTDPTFFAPAGTPPTRPDGPFRLVSVGRLVGWKGFDRLVTAVAQVRDQGHDLVCEIAGEGPQRRRLEQTIAELGLQGRVILRGLLDRGALRELLASADAFVAPSIGLDAFSVATVEAASMGLPLLLSDRVGAREALSEEDFIEFPALDTVALARGIVTLIERRRDAQWTARMARHARIRRVFAPEVVAARLLALAGCGG